MTILLSMLLIVFLLYEPTAEMQQHISQDHPDLYKPSLEESLYKSAPLPLQQGGVGLDD